MQLVLTLTADPAARRLAPELADRAAEALRQGGARVGRGHAGRGHGEQHRAAGVSQG